MDLVKEAIGIVNKIKDMVVKFNRNNKECDEIFYFVTTLGTDLEVLQGEKIVEHPSVHAAMERLKNSLLRAQMGVEKCKTGITFLRAFNADDIAAKLEGLRTTISFNMVSVNLLTGLITNSQVDKMDKNVEKNFVSTNRQLDGILCTYYGIDERLLKLEQLLNKQNLAISDSTGDASNKSKRSGGLTQYSSWSDLVAQTKLSNNNIISKGSSRSVYKATLSGTQVAIKKYHQFDEQVKARFVDELRLTRKLQHQNIVKLVGYCFEYNESLLLMKSNDVKVKGKGCFGFISGYISKQSMAQIITKANKNVVGWPSLFGMIQGIAKGVRYLHGQNVVHLDLKPENILLDTAGMSPKIINFGKAQPIGKEGLGKEDLPVDGKYVAPELSASTTSAFLRDKFRIGHKASAKLDVYSFGVILLESIGAMYAKEKEGHYPTDPKAWAERSEESELIDIFDGRRLSGAQRNAARWCVIVGLMCCQPDPTCRPSMEKVIDMLGSCTRNEDDEVVTGYGLKLQEAGSTSYKTQQGQSLGSRGAGDSTSTVVRCECGHGPHWPVSCTTASSYLGIKSEASSLDNTLYEDHYLRWEASLKLAHKADDDMERINKERWFENMAKRMAIPVAELGFLTRAYDEIVKCRFMIPWVHAYGYFLLDRNRRARFDRLQDKASNSLARLHELADDARGNLSAAEVETLAETFAAFKTELMELTKETRQDFEKLVKAIRTDRL